MSEFRLKGKRKCCTFVSIKTKILCLSVRNKILCLLWTKTLQMHCLVYYYVICYVLLLINAVERKEIQLYKIRYKSR